MFSSNKTKFKRHIIKDCDTRLIGLVKSGVINIDSILAGTRILGFLGSYRTDSINQKYSYSRKFSISEDEVESIIISSVEEVKNIWIK